MSRMNKTAVGVALGLVLAVLTLVAIRHERATVASPGSAAKAPLYWYDPMHPGEHFDKPGKSPFMDMQLLPKYADREPVRGPQAGDDPHTGAAAHTGDMAHTGTDAHPARIAIDPRVAQNLGIRLAPVEQGDFARTVDTVGSIGVDEHRIVAVQVREAGWVERLDVRAVGDSVRRGQRLAGIYSPNLLATQQELLIAHESGDPALIAAARERLSLFGLSGGQLDRIEKSGRVERRVDYFAPFDGYVMELGVRQGAAVEPGALLFQLADLRSVWLTAEIAETQAAWIKPGDVVEAGVPALPGVRFRGRVDYLYPELTQATRTLRVRIVLDNPRQQLRPGMFASAHLHADSQPHVLTVPSESVITTGTRSVVIVADDATHFRPVLVHVGGEQGGRSAVLEGLELGQQVVASGQFLIDSEANLRGAFDNLAGAH